MTYTEIITDIQNRLPTNYFSDTLDSTEFLALLNQVQRWVCRGSYRQDDGRHNNHNFSWLKQECTQSTSDETQRYVLPDGTDADPAGNAIWRFKEEIAVELVDKDNYRVPLTKVIKKNAEDDVAFVDTSDSGTPQVYAIDQREIWLYPKPDHDDNGGSAWTINLEYYGFLPDLSASNASNFLTNHCPEILLYEGLSLAYEIGGDYDKVAYFHSKAYNLFVELIQEDIDQDFSGIETGSIPTTPNALGKYPSMVSIQTTGGYVDE